MEKTYQLPAKNDGNQEKFIQIKQEQFQDQYTSKDKENLHHKIKNELEKKNNTVQVKASEQQYSFHENKEEQNVHLKQTISPNTSKNLKQEKIESAENNLPQLLFIDLSFILHMYGLTNELILQPFQKEDKFSINISQVDEVVLRKKDILYEQKIYKEEIVEIVLMIKQIREETLLKKFVQDETYYNVIYEQNNLTSNTLITEIDKEQMYNINFGIKFQYIKMYESLYQRHNIQIDLLYIENNQYYAYNLFDLKNQKSYFLINVMSSEYFYQNLLPLLSINQNENLNIYLAKVAYIDFEYQMVYAINGKYSIYQLIDIYKRFNTTIPEKTIIFLLNQLFQVYIFLLYSKYYIFNFDLSSFALYQVEVENMANQFYLKYINLISITNNLTKALTEMKCMNSDLLNEYEEEDEFEYQYSEEMYIKVSIQQICLNMMNLILYDPDAQLNDKEENLQSRFEHNLIQIKELYGQNLSDFFEKIYFLSTNNLDKTSFEQEIFKQFKEYNKSELYQLIIIQNLEKKLMEEQKHKLKQCNKCIYYQKIPPFLSFLPKQQLIQLLQQIFEYPTIPNRDQIMDCRLEDYIKNHFYYYHVFLSYFDIITNQFTINNISLQDTQQYDQFILLQNFLPKFSDELNQNNDILSNYKKQKQAQLFQYFLKQELINQRHINKNNSLKINQLNYGDLYKFVNVFSQDYNGGCYKINQHLDKINLQEEKLENQDKQKSDLFYIYSYKNSIERLLQHQIDHSSESVNESHELDKQILVGFDNILFHLNRILQEMRRKNYQNVLKINNSFIKSFKTDDKIASVNFTIVSYQIKCICMIMLNKDNQNIQQELQKLQKIYSSRIILNESYKNFIQYPQRELNEQSKKASDYFLRNNINNTVLVEQCFNLNLYCNQQSTETSHNQNLLKIAQSNQHIKNIQFFMKEVITAELNFQKKLQQKVFLFQNILFEQAKLAHLNKSDSTMISIIFQFNKIIFYKKVQLQEDLPLNNFKIKSEEDQIPQNEQYKAFQDFCQSFTNDQYNSIDKLKDQFKDKELNESNQEELKSNTENSETQINQKFDLTNQINKEVTFVNTLLLVNQSKNNNEENIQTCHMQTQPYNGQFRTQNYQKLDKKHKKIRQETCFIEQKNIQTDNFFQTNIDKQRKNIEENQNELDPYYLEKINQKNLRDTAVIDSSYQGCISTKFDIQSLKEIAIKQYKDKNEYIKEKENYLLYMKDCKLQGLICKLIKYEDSKLELYLEKGICNMTTFIKILKKQTKYYKEFEQTFARILLNFINFIINMHDKKYYHGDIKPQNFIIQKEQLSTKQIFGLESQGRLGFKFIDFQSSSNNPNNYYKYSTKIYKFRKFANICDQNKMDWNKILFAETYSACLTIFYSLSIKQRNFIKNKKLNTQQISELINLVDEKKKYSEGLLYFLAIFLGKNKVTQKLEKEGLSVNLLNYFTKLLIGTGISINVKDLHIEEMKKLSYQSKQIPNESIQFKKLNAFSVINKLQKTEKKDYLYSQNSQEDLKYIIDQLEIATTYFKIHEEEFQGLENYILNNIEISEESLLYLLELCCFAECHDYKMYPQIIKKLKNSHIQEYELYKNSKTIQLIIKLLNENNLSQSEIITSLESLQINSSQNNEQKNQEILYNFYEFIIQRIFQSEDDLFNNNNLIQNQIQFIENMINSDFINDYQKRFFMQFNLFLYHNSKNCSDEFFCMKFIKYRDLCRKLDTRIGRESAVFYNSRTYKLKDSYRKIIQFENHIYIDTRSTRKIQKYLKRIGTRSEVIFIESCGYPQPISFDSCFLKLTQEMDIKQSYNWVLKFQ